MAFESQRNEYGLTPRQWESLSLLVRGYTREEIAERTGVSVNTTKVFLREVFREMGFRSNVDACLWWVRTIGIPAPRDEVVAL